MDPKIESLTVKIFADGADLSGMIEMASKPYISGLTTNPTLMKKAGITNYEEFAKRALSEIKTLPISFEIFSDDNESMKRQGEMIASWGENVFVKIPITNTQGLSTKPVISYLSRMGVKVNVTALMSVNQIKHILDALNPEVENYISVFAGRIADTGRNPIPVMNDCLELLRENHKSELIWASPREVLNIYQANEIGCHIITATNDILQKLVLHDKDLEEYSLETVQMFHRDAQTSGFSI
jgi:transaldolase